MNELVFKSEEQRIKELREAFVDFIEKMFSSIGGIIEINENEFGKYMFADGTVFNQVDLADLLIQYALNHSFDNAVIINNFLFGECGMLHYAILKTMAEVIKKERKSTADRKTYLMLDRKTGLIKIGATCDLQGRLNTLACGNANLIIIATLNKNVETELHRKYKDKKVEREFYSLTKEDIDSIINEYGFDDSLICVKLTHQ